MGDRTANTQYTTEIDGQNIHFAAMEAPDLLIGDVREFFRRLRRYKGCGPDR